VRVAGRLESIGFKVILKAMDWSTNLVARARKEPPSKGAWNLLHTWWQAADVINPAIHFGLSGVGPRAWFGWPDVPQLEKLVSEWVRTTEETKRKQLVGEIQKFALSEVIYVFSSSRSKQKKRRHLNLCLWRLPLRLHRCVSGTGDAQWYLRTRICTGWATLSTARGIGFYAPEC
jgi:ABC-type transport system substrate-binding protein